MTDGYIAQYLEALTTVAKDAHFASLSKRHPCDGNWAKIELHLDAQGKIAKNRDESVCILQMPIYL